jgi:hypothetical protein
MQEFCPTFTRRLTCWWCSRWWAACGALPRSVLARILCGDEDPGFLRVDCLLLPEDRAYGCLQFYFAFYAWRLLDLGTTERAAALYTGVWWSCIYFSSIQPVWITGILGFFSLFRRLDGLVSVLRLVKAGLATHGLGFVMVSPSLRLACRSALSLSDGCRGPLPLQSRCQPPLGLR